ncbi:hypothetical protein HC031_15270 [Planosporangium thailandense]|uniref:Uncharacterized protein n=1 Tax=Planosporangium thailandense TaxID=765197 RepID=A0ABX0XYG4_9ACTN|nr:hypothetical protein [Planosporangium thailandense]NJC71061.1 hypothetical protein [Planosporangium thailandense]
MIRPRPRIQIAAIAAIGVGAALAYAVPAGAAVAVQSQSPPVQAVKLGSTATLDAKGAVVFAPVSVACRPGSFAYLTVAVTENVGNAIASGQASTSIEQCTGSAQGFKVAVTPTQKPFRTGVAFGSAQLQVCADTCRTVVDQHNIQIVKK